MPLFLPGINQCALTTLEEIIHDRFIMWYVFCGQCRQSVYLSVRVRSSDITSGTGKKFCSFVAPVVVYNESCVDVLH